MPQPKEPAIHLQPWRVEHAPRLAELLGNPHVTRFLTPQFPRPYRLQEARDFISLCQENDLPERGICFQGVIVGGIGARIDNDTAVIGYWLGEPYWRQGIMTRALALYLDLLPELAPQARHITALVYDFNRASQRLLQSSGFRQLPECRVLPACDGLEHPLLCYGRDL